MQAVELHLMTELYVSGGFTDETPYIQSWRPQSR